jgi:hypothetical protein
MVKKSTILAVMLAVAGASVATVAAVKPDLLKKGLPPGSKGTTGSGTNGTQVPNQGEDLYYAPSPPVYIGGGGSSGGSSPPDDTVPPQGGGAPSGATTPPGGGYDQVIEEPGPPKVVQEQPPAQQQEVPFVTTTTREGKVVKLSASTGLALTAGTPIAEGVVERVNQLNKNDKQLSLIVTAAFEPLGKETSATSVRGTPLAQTAIARTQPTLGGILETEAGGSRAIRGSPELFKRLEANLLASVERNADGGGVIVPPNQILGDTVPTTDSTVSCGTGTRLENVGGIPTCVLIASKSLSRGTQRYSK